MHDIKGVGNNIADTILKLDAASWEMENFGDSKSIFFSDSFSISSRSGAVRHRIRTGKEMERINKKRIRDGIFIRFLFYELFRFALNCCLLEYKIFAITANIITYGSIRTIPRNPPPTNTIKEPMMKMGMNGVSRI